MAVIVVIKSIITLWHMQKCSLMALSPDGPTIADVYAERLTNNLKALPSRSRVFQTFDLPEVNYGVISHLHD